MKQGISKPLIDIDHFKQINDRYGHQSGDDILKQVAVLLRKMTRSQDIVSRNGGEEFSIIFPHCSLEQAAEASERIRLAVSEHHFTVTSQEKIKLTISVGVASWNNKQDNSAKIIEQADDALYKAKHSGRNKVVTEGYFT